MLNYAAVEDIQFEVKYYITAKGMPNPFIKMIEQIKEDFNKYPQMMKLIINSIWGYLMKTKSSATILHVDEDIRRISENAVICAPFTYVFTLSEPVACVVSSVITK